MARAQPHAAHSRDFTAVSRTARSLDLEEGGHLLASVEPAQRSGLDRAGAAAHEVAADGEPPRLKAHRLLFEAERGLREGGAPALCGTAGPNARAVSGVRTWRRLAAAGMAAGMAAGSIAHSR